MDEAESVLVLSPRAVYSILILIVLLLPHTTSNHAEAFASKNLEAVSVLSKLVIDRAGAHSWVNDRPAQDCMRPKQVECFSIQQNLWIFDSRGNFVLWAQNAIELARVKNGDYFGTYTFQIWSSSGLTLPLLCEPESGNGTDCRAPFYSDLVIFPETFNFYSHISNEGSDTILQMVNNLGSINWQIPSSINCPCYLGAAKQRAPPWGYSPFELVMVGIDSLSIAIFRNDTLGTVGPVLVQSTDGAWHQTILKTLQCRSPRNCPTPTSTGEFSMYLVWNNTSVRLYWSEKAYDQGVYISEVSNDATTPPPAMIDPPVETYLYLKLTAALAYFTIYDEQQQAIGFDQRTNRWVQQIPNSTIIFDRSEEVMILNPVGAYELTLIAGGNTKFNLFMSLSSNRQGVSVKRNVVGTLTMGDSKHYDLGSKQLELNSTDTAFQAAIPDLLLIVGIVAWVSVIIAILILRRRRRDDSD
jgi:hypothetical protein